MLKTVFKSLAVLLLASTTMVPFTNDHWQMVGPAMADDDGGDDGDDGDDDGNDDDGGRSGERNSPSAGEGSGALKRDLNRLRNIFQPRRSEGQTPRRQRQSPRRSAAPQPAPPPPEFAENEIVTFGLTTEDLAQLLAQNYRLIEERTLASLANTTIQRLAVPQGQTLADARIFVRSLPSGGSADFNHFYRTNEELGAELIAQPASTPCKGPHCANRALVGWSDDLFQLGTCSGDVTIGMIDTGLNEMHETFANVDLTVHRLTSEDTPPSRAYHGTAVAALLVGAPDSRSPGLLPKTRMVAVDAFHRAGSDERADVFTLVGGLSYLADQNVNVFNLSFAGPPNTVLEQAVVELVQTHNKILVASAGNAGPQSDPLYPAAYEPVIAVTAIDRRNSIYRRAVQGAHIDIAAPGVEIWTAASVKGARWRTGTSFAAPYVSAAAALLLSQSPALTPPEVRRILTDGATDLGAEGRDDVYGHGVVSFDRLCE